MSKSNERLLKELEDKDTSGIALSDSLDVKASIVLLLATFLSTESAYLFDKHPSGITFYFIVVAGVSLATSLLAAIVTLWPRTYIYPEPESTSSRLYKLEKIFNEFEGMTNTAEEIERNVLDQPTFYEIGWCRGRIANNRRNNRIKAWWLNTSFYATAAALFFTLSAFVLLSHLF
jgi:hypothetical protein